MIYLYAWSTEKVKPKCTCRVVYDETRSVHHAFVRAGRAKRVVSRLKRPTFAPTFVKEWRKHRNLTQEQLAERVAQYLIEHGIGKGYTHASIGRLENGKMPYTQPILEALAWSLGTDCPSLLIPGPQQR